MIYFQINEHFHKHKDKIFKLIHQYMKLYLLTVQFISNEEFVSSFVSSQFFKKFIVLFSKRFKIKVYVYKHTLYDFQVNLRC